jgi:hypothetical protein
VNADGYADLLVGAPYGDINPGYLAAGEATVYSVSTVRESTTIVRVNMAELSSWAIQWLLWAT